MKRKRISRFDNVQLPRVGKNAPDVGGAEPRLQDNFHVFRHAVGGAKHSVRGEFAPRASGGDENASVVLGETFRENSGIEDKRI